MCIRDVRNFTNFGWEATEEETAWETSQSYKNNIKMDL
jgi:hypothetical protein